MKWQLQYSPDKIDFLENRAIETGQVAQALKNRPDVQERLQPFWEAFWVVHPSRSIGMKAGAISIDSIVSYLRLLGYSSMDELRRGAVLVMALDNEWRKWNDEQG